jgi:class 3 adenylate cyclase
LRLAFVTAELPNLLTQSITSLFIHDTAIVVVFAAMSPSPDHMAEAVSRATLCSLQLLNELDPFPVDKDLSLRIHLGTGAGKLYGMHVGGLGNRWEYFAAGPALSQLKYALDAAKQGEVGLSPEAWSLVDRRLYPTNSSVKVGSADEPQEIVVLSSSNYGHIRGGFSG